MGEGSQMHQRAQGAVRGNGLGSRAATTAQLAVRDTLRRALGLGYVASACWPWTEGNKSFLGGSQWDPPGGWCKDRNEKG